MWHHFEVKFLPGYSPDFNPIERLLAASAATLRAAGGRLSRSARFWLRLKADSFRDWIAHTPDELTERLCTALCAFMDDPKKVASQCATRK